MRTYFGIIVVADRKLEEISVWRLGDMLNFTGYEPKARVRASGSQLVPADTLDQDLSMLSSLDEFIGEDISSSGPKGLATPLDDLTDAQDDTYKRLRDSKAKAKQRAVVPMSLGAPKGDASKASSSSGPAKNLDDTEEILYDTVSDLAEENARLHELIEQRDAEILRTRIHAENYATQAVRDTRGRAEQALAYQKGIFEHAHEEYATTVKDMASSYHASATAQLEAAANSIIGQQQGQLENASMVVASLQQHLDQAQEEIELEAKDKQMVEAKAKAEVLAQKKSSERELTSLRAVLEKDANEKHVSILADRVNAIKAEAEERHKATMVHHNKTLSDLRAQLQQVSEEKQTLEIDLATVSSHMEQTQVSLTKAESLLETSREGSSLLEKDLSKQLDINKRLDEQIPKLKKKIEDMHEQMNASQSEQTADIQRRLETAEGSVQSLTAKVDKLLDEIEVHKRSAEAQRKQHKERIAELITEHKKELGEKEDAFNHAQESILILQDEIATLEETVQEHMDKAFSFQQAADEKAEHYEMHRDDSTGPEKEKPRASPPGQGAPFNFSASGPRGPAAAAPSSNEAPKEDDMQQRKQQAKAALAPIEDQLVTHDVEQAVGGNTPTLSAIPPAGTGGLIPYGKKTADKIDIGGWPSIKSFIPWKLAFFKAVAAASVTPDEAFVWICEVMKATSYEELSNSGNFVALDALLSSEWSKIMSGEFKKSVQIIEQRLLKEQKMLKGRQITWLVFDYFKLADTDSAMLNWDEIIKLTLHMPGDNIKQFLNDWDMTFENINGTPDPALLESLFRRQLEKSNQLKQTMALYEQEITQGKAQRDYERLRWIVNNYMAEQLLKRNQANLAKGPKAFGAVDGAGGKQGKPGKNSQRAGWCPQWCKSGDCAAGTKCPFASSHTPENKSWFAKQGQQQQQPTGASAKAKGKGKGKRSSTPSKERGRSQTRKPRKNGSRSNSRGSSGSRSSKGSQGKGARPSTPNGKPKKRTGTSPSGEKDRPACFRWLAGKCTKGKECKWWHSGPCADFAKGNCKKGKHCEFVHHTDKVKAAIKKTNENKASHRPCRFFTPKFFDDTDDEDYPGLVSSDSEDEACAPRGVAYRVQSDIKFSDEDLRKSLADASVPNFQPRNKAHVNHRTDEDGNVIFDDEETILQNEDWARKKALNWSLDEDLKEFFENIDVEKYFVQGDTARKVYSGELFKEPSAKPKTNKNKRQKKKLKKAEKLRANREVTLAAAAPTAAASSSRGNVRPRRYIVDSGASFHLVDPRTLTARERATIEEVDEPVPIETANGEVVLYQRCRVYVVELKIEVMAYLHEDTVCVLSLGLLVDRNGFTYLWRPGKAPELKRGKFVVSCSPHFNVPFIYAASARGLPLRENPKIAANYEKIMKDEVKGTEDTPPPPPEPFKGKDAGRESSPPPRRRSQG